MDQPNGFPGNHGRNIEIAGGLGRRIFGGDRAHILQQFEFAAGPATRMTAPKVLLRGRRWAISRRNSIEWPFFWSG